MPQRHPVINEQAGELKFGQVGVANLRIRELDIEMLVQEIYNVKSREGAVETSKGGKKLVHMDPSIEEKKYVCSCM